MITLTREQVESLIKALNSNNGPQQHIAVMFLQSLLVHEGDD